MTITAALPPSSRTTFFLPASRFIRQPTSALPVNVSIRKRSSSTSRCPMPRSQATTFSPPAGTPASWQIEARASAESGVALAGFTTLAQPAAIAGPTL
jgi:hypothetical protein